jgi:hypothetical protein
LNYRTLGLVLGAASLALLVGLGFLGDPATSPGEDIIATLAFVSPSLVGVYLSWRVPSNPVGVILAGFGCSFLLGVFAETLAPMANPLASWGAWVGTWAWAVSMLLLLVLLPLYFPDGRLPARSQWIKWTGITGLALLIAGNGFRSSFRLGNEGTFDSPFAFFLPADVSDVLATVGMVLAVTGVIAALVKSVLRFRRSEGLLRQQMKVFAGAIVFGVIGMSLNLIAYESGLEEVGNVVFSLLVVVLVMSIAVAVTRYRLYDLGRIVSRTVAYTVVAAIVIGTYALTVFAVASVAAGSTNSFTVAVATLTAAAVFRPALRRVQGFVDRRFSREKYDAQQTIEGFSARMSLETDLDDLTRDLVGVVDTTMRPDHLKVWLAH